MTAVAPTTTFDATDGQSRAPASRLRSATGPLGLLTLVIAASYGIPARQTVPLLGALGRPALLISLGLGGLWLLTRVLPDPSRDRLSPVRTIVVAWLLAESTAWILGWGRGLPPLEASSADRAILSRLALAGIALYVLDGISSRRDLDLLLRRLTWAGGFLAAIGAIQFFTGVNLASRISLPGLELNAPLIEVSARGDTGARRVAGTAAHFIEFGVVLGMLTPLAIHYALYAPTAAARSRRWALVVLTIAAVPFSISRSGTLALGAAIIPLFWVWPVRRKLNAIAAAGIGALAFRTLVPGLLGTIRSLWESVGSDASSAGRTSDYEVVSHLVAQRPLFGRGPGTFLPEQYILLDNQWLGTVVTSGLVGLAVLVAVFVVAIRSAHTPRWKGGTSEDRHLGQAIGASLLAAVVSSATFDSLGFPTFAATTFLLIGAAGNLRRWTSTAPSNAQRSALLPTTVALVGAPPRPIAEPVTPTVGSSIRPVGTTARSSTEPRPIQPPDRMPKPTPRSEVPGWSPIDHIPTSTVLMITHQRPSYTRMALERLLGTIDDHSEVWIWHNGDHRETRSVVREFSEHPRVARVKFSKQNIGIRAPTNWLWRQSTTDLVSKVDDDCLVDPNWLQVLRQAHVDNPGFGVVGSWRHPIEDLRPDLVDKKLHTFAKGHRLMVNLWVQGSGYLMKRSCLEQAGLLDPGQSFTEYCIRLGVGGWVNGWLWPFVPEQHLDDPRVPGSMLRSDLDLAEHLPLSARATGVRTIDEWVDQLRRSALVLQTSSIDPRDYVGWRRIRQRARRRFLTTIGRSSAYRPGANR